MPVHSLVGAVRSAIVRGAMPCLIAASLAAPAAAAFAAPVEISLPEAVRRASERVPMLEARRASVEAARQDSHRAGALPDPTLIVGISNLPVTGSDAFDDGIDPMTMKRIGLRQAFPARAKREAQRALALRRTDEAQALETAERLDVQRASAEAWIGLWARQRELQKLHALREQAQLAARLARAGARSGGSLHDALAAEAAVLELDNDIAAAEAAQVEAREALQRWIGATADGALRAADTTPDFTTTPHSQSELLVALDRLPALQPVDAQLETAAAAVDAARAEKRPDWSVTASYGQRQASRSDMLMLEFGVGLPLFTRNRQDRGIAARQADYQAALATREDQRRQLVARIRAAFAQWEGSKRVVALHEDAQIPLARDRSSTALAAYRAGGELRPWLDAHQDELELHLMHVQHLAQLGRAWAAVAFLLTSETQP
ncbi:TolC family protein [Luteimonas suaedae]|uniref:TolC family protein n=1 Tax=Luteimonas suaedae TaxID=2605430 RepID=UPI0021063A29|nr:TolC family protein [Luteimonas suaedae]